MIKNNTMPTPVVRAFIVTALLAAGTLLTMIMVLAGWDWAYFVWVQTDGPRGILRPANQAGFVIPVLLPVVLLMGAALVRSRNMMLMALAVAGAALSGLALSMAVKSVSGRRSPPHHSFGASLEGADNSQAFQFGFMNERLIGGWPSSHTTVSFAVAVCLVLLLRGRPVWQLLSLATALFISWGVTLGYHWLSDFAAGVCLGTAIGLLVGWSFMRGMKVPAVTAG